VAADSVVACVHACLSLPLRAAASAAACYFFFAFLRKFMLDKHYFMHHDHDSLQLQQDTACRLTKSSKHGLNTCA
jgi:hypothetical protein